MLKKISILTNIIFIVIIFGLLLYTLSYVSTTKHVLKTLNDKYNTIKDENKRLKDRINELISQQSKKYNKDKIVDWILAHSKTLSRKQANIIYEEAMKTKYPLLILALIERESNFNICAVSKAGAIGLGQILPNKYQLDLLIKNNIINEKRDLFNIENNIRATEFILDLKLSKSKNLTDALYKYVGGKNKKYVRDILSNLGELLLVSKTERIEKVRTEKLK